MKFEVHHYHHFDEGNLIISLLRNLISNQEKIMSAISDFATKQKAFNQEISDDLDTIKASIGTMNDLIKQLQDSAGKVTPEDQSLIDQLQQEGADLATKADATAGKTPPTPPVTP